MIRLASWAAATAVVLAGCAPGASEDAPQKEAGREEHVHFLIPGAPGGGWDATARGVGGALLEAGLVEGVSFENLSGGGGGRALAHLIANAPRQEQTWMVTSTPIVLRSLRGRLPQSFRDLTPIAAVIGDYMTFAVRAGSDLESWSDVTAAFRADPRSVKVAGGSVRGGLDHLVTGLALQAAGEDATQLRYVGYDTGGKAMIALLSGEVPVLATGLGEAMESWRSGQIRLLGVTSQVRVPEAPEIATLTELGAAIDFINWRGFFAVPDAEGGRIEGFLELLEKLFSTAEWERVRSRNGWVQMFKPGAEFESFLDDQELAMEDLYHRLGMKTLNRPSG